MSEAKFTKGPWAVTTNSAGVIEVTFEHGSCRGDEYLCIHPTSLSSIERSVDCTDGQAALANAHLIAAAPEMYEFIKCFMLNIPEITDDAEKLLAKARGEL